MVRRWDHISDHLCRAGSGGMQERGATEGFGCDGALGAGTTECETPGCVCWLVSVFGPGSGGRYLGFGI